MWKYLRSPSAKLVAAHASNQKRKVDRRLSPEDVTKTAKNLNPWRQGTEPVRLRQRLKKDGRTRNTFSYGPRDRAEQTLVKSAIEANSKLHPAQTVTAGGRPKACQDVLDAMKGHRYVVKLDIKDCFPSLAVHLATDMLPLPARVSCNVLTLKNREIEIRRDNKKSKKNRNRKSRPIRRNSAPIITKLHNNIPTVTSGARHGLTQGSVASSIAAEVLLSPLPRALPDGTCVVVYADDILLFANSRDEAYTILIALLDAMEAHPTGLTVTDDVEVRRVSDGFDFLGWHFRTLNGVPQLKPSKKAQQRFHKKLKSKISAGLDGLDYARAWARSFAPWIWDAASTETTVARVRQGRSPSSMVGIRSFHSFGELDEAGD